MCLQEKQLACVHSKIVLFPTKKNDKNSLKKKKKRTGYKILHTDVSNIRRGSAPRAEFPNCSSNKKLFHTNQPHCSYQQGLGTLLMRHQREYPFHSQLRKPIWGMGLQEEIASTQFTRKKQHNFINSYRKIPGVCMLYNTQFQQSMRPIY